MQTESEHQQGRSSMVSSYFINNDQLCSRDLNFRNRDFVKKRELDLKTIECIETDISDLSKTELSAFLLCKRIPLSLYFPARGRVFFKLLNNFRE